VIQIQIYTIASNNYLPKVLILFESIRKHHPEWVVNLLLVDSKKNDINYDDLLADRVWELSDLNIPNLKSWMFGHTIVELATAVKPFMAAKLLAITDCKKVFFFDPDIVLFSRLDDIVEELNHFSIVLTPHQTVPETSLEAISDNELCSLKHGVFNLGFLGLSSSETTDEFILWWSKRLYHLCEADISRGLFTDQKWIDLVPVFFSGVKILKSDRFNVATWNLTNRYITTSANGIYLVNGLPLGFYHFSGWDSGACAIMSRKNGGDNLAVEELILWYSSEINSSKYQSTTEQIWSFNCFSNGSQISIDQRRLYKNRLDLQRAFTNPFESNQYLAWWNSSHNQPNKNSQKFYKIIARLNEFKRQLITVLTLLSKLEFAVLWKKVLFKFKSKHVYRESVCQKKSNPYDLSLFQLTEESQQAKHLLNSPVDVIVPIFNGLGYVRSLLDSVVKNTEKLRYRLLLVDDASTDVNISVYLADFCLHHGSAVLLRNDKNLGFIGSVNKAFSYVESEFFVILNSDTEVPQGWLNRLISPLLGDEKVATTTPFSNSGTLNSFPHLNKDNELYGGFTVGDLDSAFKSLPTLRHQLIIPTGVGFCMGCRTVLAKNYGFFDPIFGRGYAEENDWCMRLSAQGFKHVLVENLFVYHKHGASFSLKEKASLINSNFEVLKNRYPFYVSEISEYFGNDPTAFLRDFVKLKLMSRSENIAGAALIVDHDMGGGANYYRHENVRRLNDKEIPVLVFVEYEGRITIKVFTRDGDFNFSISSLDYLDLIFSQIRISEVIYNNLVGAKDPLNIIAAIINLKKKHPFKLTYLLHDFFGMCPSFRLVNEKGQYCGASTDLNTCRKCSARQSTEYSEFIRPHEDIQAWRISWEGLLVSSDEIITFSSSSKDILLKIYPSLTKKPIVVRHHEFSKNYLRPVRHSDSISLVNIGVVGGINYAKGGEVVRRLIKTINQRGKKDITLSVVGEVGVDLSGAGITVTGRYVREDLVERVEGLGINVFLMPSIWPETYSYVTDELIAMNLPIVCFNVGAQAERISRYPKGLVLGLDIPTPELLDQILVHVRRCSLNLHGDAEFVLDDVVS
jgi:GT2 family glycosyltransferase/glycosyltransferase involved in cell wall biosynthesis